MPNLIFQNIFLPLALLMFGTFYIMTLLAVKLLMVLLWNWNHLILHASLKALDDALVFKYFDANVEQICNELYA